MGIALSALKELDHAKYLACLFVPEEKREAFAALNAYAAELSRIPMVASEPLPGEIRLQWWRDVIAGDRTVEAAGHPVASNLLSAIQAHRLPQAPLEAMSEARIFDLYNDPMPDVSALETYLGETEAALIQLGCLVLDQASAANAAEAAGHAGMAIGVSGILKHLPRNTARQRMFIPETILNATGHTIEQVFAGDQQTRAKAVMVLVALGRDHLKAFKHS
ncbi:MAG: squalene/phytoene synthase family protein, partial [Notoacmeibacter sp.]